MIGFEEICIWTNSLTPKVRAEWHPNHFREILHRLNVAFGSYNYSLTHFKIPHLICILAALISVHCLLISCNTFVHKVKGVSFRVWINHSVHTVGMWRRAMVVQGMQTSAVRRPLYDCSVCLLRDLIRHDILIFTQMYHKVIIEYFPKTKQNIAKSPNCLLTGRVKIAHLKAVEACRLWVRLLAVPLGMRLTAIYHSH